MKILTTIILIFSCVFSAFAVMRDQDGLAPLHLAAGKGNLWPMASDFDLVLQWATVLLENRLMIKTPANISTIPRMAGISNGCL